MQGLPNLWRPQSEVFNASLSATVLSLACSDQLVFHTIAMSHSPMTCAIYQDESRVRLPFVDRGGGSLIFRYETTTKSDIPTVLKIPQRYGKFSPDGTMVPDPRNEYASNLDNEKAIYKRLQGTPGIANYLGAAKDGFLLEYHKQGCLEDFMYPPSLRQTAPQETPAPKIPPPEWPQRKNWILQILDIYTAIHAQKVLVRDIALRNLLLADDFTIRAIDFEQSWLLPLDHTGELHDEDGYTEMAEISNVANVIYSLSRWEKFEKELLRMEEWPDAKELPSAVDLPLGRVIADAWSRRFGTIDELRQATVSALTSTPSVGRTKSNGLQ